MLLLTQLERTPVAACAGGSAMDFEPVIENLPRLLSGFVLTLELTPLRWPAAWCSLFPLALLRVSRNSVLWVPVYGYIFLFRGTPLLIQI